MLSAIARSAGTGARGSEQEERERRGGRRNLAFSVPEVAEMLGISRASAYTYVRTGIIRSVSLGGRIVVPRRVLHDLMNLDDAG